MSEGTTTGQRGGKRRGAGRPRMASGSRVADTTKSVRLPIEVLERYGQRLEKLSELIHLLQDWEFRIGNARKISKNGRSPRYDKADEMIGEIYELLDIDRYDFTKIASVKSCNNTDDDILIG